MVATEHTTYTWDPVTAAWVHERGPQITPPPRPPDVHALQSYFFDQDSKEWIRTVLAPMGRELAARYQGAHKIPEAGRDAKTKGAKDAKRSKAATAANGETKKRGNTVVVAVVIVLLVLLGGVGVVASQSGLLADTSAALKTTAPESVAPSAAGSAAAVPTGGAQASSVASAAPTAVPTTAPTAAPVRTPAPVNIPPGPNATLPDGTVVVYTGPLSATRGSFLPASFTVIAPNGRPGSGDITIVLGDITKDPRIVSGQLDANGKIALDVPATLALGQYPLSVVYKGSRAFLATITLR